MHAAKTYRSETFPVDSAVIQKTIDGVFRVVLFEPFSCDLHIHRSVGKHQANQIAEYLNDCNALSLTCSALAKQVTDLV